MRARANTGRRRILGITVALAVTFIAAGGAMIARASSLAPVAALAADPIDLCAKAGTLDLPGGTTVPVWGFARLDAGQTCADVTPGSPGPVLDVPVGTSVTITVHNDLAEAVSLELPGQTVAQDAPEAPPGGTAAFSFTASAPGTYLYASPNNAGRQRAMGLYGALIVRPTTDGRAYDDAASGFDVEKVLVLSAIDPAFNANPDDFDTRTFAPTYWLIDGKAYPDTEPIDAGAVGAGRRVLLRYVNAGFDNSSMALLGVRERVLARDAHPLNNPFSAVAETIPAGSTADAIVDVSAPGRYPLYNRQLHLTNGSAALGSPGYWPGGMLTYITGQ
jgi:FtsP/CotA-like multicopper oxidase with cupredoxin domain